MQSTHGVDELTPRKHELQIANLPKIVPSKETAKQKMDCSGARANCDDLFSSKNESWLLRTSQAAVFYKAHTL